MQLIQGRSLAAMIDEFAKLASIIRRRRATVPADRIVSSVPSFQRFISSIGRRKPSGTGFRAAQWNRRHGPGCRPDHAADSPFGSLADGLYRLTVVAAQVSGGGQPLDGDDNLTC
jgi:hypothetical protein